MHHAISKIASPGTNHATATAIFTQHLARRNRFREIALDIEQEFRLPDGLIGAAEEFGLLKMDFFKVAVQTLPSQRAPPKAQRALEAGHAKFGGCIIDAAQKHRGRNPICSLNRSHK